MLRFFKNFKKGLPTFSFSGSLRLKGRNVIFLGAPGSWDILCSARKMYRMFTCGGLLLQILFNNSQFVFACDRLLLPILFTEHIFMDVYSSTDHMYANFKSVAKFGP